MGGYSITPPSFNRFGAALERAISFLFLMTTMLAGCVSDPVLDAFDGDFDRVKETKTIVYYCQSCHNHKDFDPVNHMAIQPISYDRAPYTEAESCRTCHELTVNFWNDYERTTHFPDGSLVDE